MGSNNIVSDVAQEVFRLLRQKGPLAPVQISSDLLIPLNEVHSALVTLRDQGIVEPRPDRDRSREYSDDLMAWGLATTFSSPRS